MKPSTKFSLKENVITSCLLYFRNLFSNNIKVSILIVFICIINTQNLFAQNKALRDSLHVALSQKNNDTVKVNILNQLSKDLYSLGELDSVLLYSNQSLKLSEKINYALGQAKSIAIIGNVHLVRNNYQEAISCNNKALKIYKELGEKRLEANTFSNLGLVYYRQGIHTKALELFLKALKIDLENKDSLNISQDYRDIGMVHKFMDEHQQALKYYQKSIEIQEAIKDSVNLGITNHNVGSVYIKMKNYPKALEFENKAIEIFNNLNEPNIHTLAFFYYNLECIYYSMGKYAEAHRSLDKAMRIFNEVGDMQSLSLCYLNKGKIRLKEKKFAEAREQIAKAKAMSKEFHNHIELRDIYINLALVDSSLGNYINAYSNIWKAYLYNDSFNNESNTKELTRLQMNFEFSQKEDSIMMVNQKELAVKEATLLAHKKQQWFMGIGIGLLCVIGGLLYTQNRVQKRNNLKLSQLNNELDEKAEQNQLLVKEMHHRIKNNLYMVYSLLDIQSHNTENKETQNQLQSARQRIESIANTHEQLYQHKPESVSMQEYINQFVNKTVQQFAHTKKIDTHIHIDAQIKLQTATCMPLAMLLNEWMTNSIKYVEDDNNEIQIYIKAYSNEANAATLEYYDNGNIYNDNIATETSVTPYSSGIGRKIIQLLSRQIQAAMENNFQNKPFHYRITFPV